MNDHQRRVIGRVADEVAAYRAGSQSLLDCLNRTWALFTAAELPPGEAREQFLDLYYAVSSEDDSIRLRELMPSVDASGARLDAALTDLQAWSIAARGSGDIAEP